QFLWMEGKTFLHGTGHGVGFRLNVHEGPQAISFRASASPAPLREGMVTSNEPGLYLEGRYGIRIENLVATVKKMETEFGVFLGFENLTMCPYERDLIDASMLTELEMDQIDDYHANVYDKLKGLVDKSSLEYLARATAKLARS
ncbi:MAG: M24 family metallopeptidase C-terminal domain-containing protein, partial [Sphaerochaetaceae bacterium]